MPAAKQAMNGLSAKNSGRCGEMAVSGGSNVIISVKPIV